MCLHNSASATYGPCHCLYTNTYACTYVHVYSTDRLYYIHVTIDSVAKATRNTYSSQEEETISTEYFQIQYPTTDVPTFSVKFFCIISNNNYISDALHVHWKILKAAVCSKIYWSGYWAFDLHSNNYVWISFGDLLFSYKICQSKYSIIRQLPFLTNNIETVSYMYFFWYN